MTVPVLWVSWHDHILARGYADQALLEAVMDRSLWRPPGALAFEHHEVRGDFPAVDGAVVVVPARHHASDEDVSRLVGELDRLAWSVVILCGDEEWFFPWRRLRRSPTRRLWIMAPEPEHENQGYLFPGGWYPNTREDLIEAQPAAEARPLNWAFAGQVTHVRRQECIAALRGLGKGRLIETAGFLQGLPPAEYLRLVASAKVIPCPSGPVQVDTSRPLSAMEAGCVPVVDLLRPTGSQFDYWELVFGPNPLPRISDWADFPGLLAQQLAEWPANANRVYAWWQQWKRRTAHRLDDDVRATSSTALKRSTPDDLVTAIVTTSPIPSHPSTAIIEETVGSIRARLPQAEIIVAIDGVRPEQADRWPAYQEYVRRLLWRCNFEWRNVVPVVLDNWGHQANAIRAALELVTTPQVLMVEHDTPLLGEIDWPGLCKVVGRGQANAIRLNPEPWIDPAWEYLMVDHETQLVDGVPLRRHMQFWQRPHLASTDFYRERIMPLFPPSSRTFVEDLVYGVVSSAWIDRGEPAWWDWRLWVYTPEGDFKRSGHTDGRGSDPKYSMSFE